MPTTVVDVCSGMPKSSRHCTILRRRPLGVGLISNTPATRAPANVRRRAMMRPMSPEPRITTLLPGAQPCKFMKFCAEPAENTPAGRVPGVPSAPAPRSREPVASTAAPAEMVCSPCGDTISTEMSRAPSPPFFTRSTLASRTTCTLRPSSVASSREAYSGPVSSSPKRCKPKPLWMHCFKMPPWWLSRSTSTTLAPFRAAEAAAAMPAAPPPITATSYSSEEHAAIEDSRAWRAPVSTPASKLAERALALKPSASGTAGAGSSTLKPSAFP